MRAVWSFWTAPFAAYQHRIWFSPRHHLLSWVLSVETARRHYAETVLVTDGPGADFLVGRLQLPFKEVMTSLDALDQKHVAW
jgi:hypothetical protein